MIKRGNEGGEKEREREREEKGKARTRYRENDKSDHGRAFVGRQSRHRKLLGAAEPIARISPPPPPFPGTEKRLLNDPAATMAAAGKLFEPRRHCGRVSETKATASLSPLLARAHATARKYNIADRRYARETVRQRSAVREEP